MAVSPAEAAKVVIAHFEPPEDDAVCTGAHQLDAGIARLGSNATRSGPNAFGQASRAERVQSFNELAEIGYAVLALDEVVASRAP